MPRPKWTPSDDQKKVIAAVAAVFDEFKDVEQRAWAAANWARENGIYPKHLAEYIDPSASTIYRHIGPDEHPAE